MRQVPGGRLRHAQVAVQLHRTCAAMAHVWRPTFEHSIAVAVLTEKNFRQVRQRCRMVGWEAFSCTLSEPHRAQVIPAGQRDSVNQSSAAWLYGNMRTRSRNDSPVRKYLPGPACGGPVRRFLLAIMEQKEGPAGGMPRRGRF